MTIYQYLSTMYFVENISFSILRVEKTTYNE